MPSVTLTCECPRIIWASRTGTPRSFNSVAARAAQVVEYDARQVRGLDEPVERSGDVAWLDRLAGAGGEHVAGLLPRAAGGDPLVQVTGTLPGQRRPGQRNQRQRPLPGHGLRRAPHELPADAYESGVDGDALVSQRRAAISPSAHFDRGRTRAMRLPPLTDQELSPFLHEGLWVAKLATCA